MAAAKKRTVSISTSTRLVSEPPAGTQHAGEHHDADDVINDGGADDGGAEEALELAQLLQGWPVMETLVAVTMVPMKRAW